MERFKVEQQYKYDGEIVKFDISVVVHNNMVELNEAVVEDTDTELEIGQYFKGATTFVDDMYEVEINIYTMAEAYIIAHEAYHAVCVCLRQYDDIGWSFTRGYEEMVATVMGDVTEEIMTKIEEIKESK